MPKNSRLKVLIVDDEPLVTIFIKRIVKEAGDEATVCYDGESALKAIEELQPDLIFMDINIKGPLDGISVIRKAADRRAVVYYVSAYTGEEIVDEALSTNPYSYLFKPVREEEIKAALTLCRKQKNRSAKKPSNLIALAKTLFYDTQKGELISEGKPVALTAAENRLMAFCAKNANQLFTCDMIKEAIWDDKTVADSTLRDLISRLRQKAPQLNIQNNFGQGYVLRV